MAWKRGYTAVLIPYRNVINQKRVKKLQSQIEVSIPYRNVINRITSNWLYLIILLSIPYRNVINFLKSSLETSLPALSFNPLQERNKPLCPTVPPSDSIPVSIPYRNVINRKCFCGQSGSKSCFNPLQERNKLGYICFGEIFNGRFNPLQERNKLHVHIGIRPDNRSFNPLQERNKRKSTFRKPRRDGMVSIPYRNVINPYPSLPEP